MIFKTGLTLNDKIHLIFWHKADISWVRYSGLLAGSCSIFFSYWLRRFKYLAFSRINLFEPIISCLTL